MIEPDHGFLKPQQTVLLKVGEIPCICILIWCLFFLENARCNITILQKIDVSSTLCLTIFCFRRFHSFHVVPHRTTTWISSVRYSCCFVLYTFALIAKLFLKTALRVGTHLFVDCRRNRDGWIQPQVDMLDKHERGKTIHVHHNGKWLKKTELWATA